MALTTTFETLTLSELLTTVKKLKQDGARFVQLCAVRVDLGFDLIYTFMQGDQMLNYRIEKLSQTDEVPSITSEYLPAFVFENEAHDLFGANIVGMAIDFHGQFYRLNEPTPMMTLDSSKVKVAKGADRAKAEAASRAAAAKTAAQKPERAEAAVRSAADPVVSEGKEASHE